MRRAVVLLLLLCSAPSLAEEAVRRELRDAGVHVPVLTKPPALLQFVAARYPPQAQAEGRTASVRLAVTIDEKGGVADVQVTSSVGEGFDEAAVEAVRQFTFSPAEIDSVPAPVQIEYVYNFTLAVPDAGAPEEVPDAGQAPAPTATLKGQLIARGSRDRIEGATVRCLDNPEVEASSDEDGQFSLEVLAGACKVRVLAANFETFDTTETLKASEVLQVVYYVRQRASKYSVIVKGSREKKEVVRRSVGREEIQKIPGSFGDPIRVIQNFPGVARAPFVGGQLIVRGANPAQTLTFLDGVEIPLLFHLGGGPSVINAEFLDRLDFYPGGFGARYGRAVGGVVDVTTRRGAADTWHGVVKVDLLDASAFVEVPITKKVSVAAAFRRSYIDALLPAVLPKDPEGGTLLILPRYWDYQVRVDVGSKRGEAGNDGASSYSVMAFGSDDILTLIATGGGRNRDVSVDFHTLFHRVNASWNYRKGPATFRLMPYVGYDLGSGNFGTTTFRLDRYTAGTRADLSVETGAHLTLRAGLDIFNTYGVGEASLPVISGTQYVGFPGAEPKTEIQRVTQLVNQFDGAAYLEGELKFGALTVTPGVRASHAFIQGQTRHAFDPRLFARYEWAGGRTALKGSLGLFTQPPPAVNMVPAPFGTPSLTHERAFQSSLGVFQRLTDFINVDVTGFYNRRFENIVSPGATTVRANNSVVAERFSNDGFGRAYGLEVMLRHEVSEKFFGWVAYTFSRSEDGRNGGDYRLNSFDQTHILTIIGSYKLPFGFELGGRFRYVTGRPATPLVRNFDSFNADSNRFAGTFGDFRSTRASPFHQLDIRLDKNFVFNTWTLGVYIDVQNVYNQKNVEQYIYDYRFRETFEVPGIPILPVLGVKASF